MSIPEKHMQTLTNYYAALKAVDMDAWMSCHNPDVVYNVNGTTPVSGRWQGINCVVQELLPRLFSLLEPGSVEIPVRWELMVADDRRSAVIFEGASKTLKGESYNNRYLQIHQFDSDGLIEEVWESFDSELATRMLFTDGEQQPMSSEGFRF